MSRARKVYIPESPTVREVLAYLQEQVIKGLKWHRVWDDQPYYTVGIGLGRPRFPVTVSLRSRELDRQAAIILHDLGIPDALATTGRCHNFNDEDYLSISGSSLSTFGRANREKILEWLAQQEAASQGKGGAA